METSSRLKIALISPLYESVPPRLYGGTERVVHQLSRGLSQAGHEVTLYASGDSTRPMQGHLVPVVSEALRLKKTPVLDPISHHIRMLGLVSEAAPKFDVIHNHADYPLLALSRMTQTPVLTTLHGRIDLEDCRAGLEGFPEARLISISHSQRQGFDHLSWFRTIPHGIDPNDFDFHPRPGKYLAFLGRIFPEKGPERAIAIAKKAGIPLKIAAKIEGPQSQAFFDQEVRPHLDGKNVEYIGEIGDAEKSEFLGNALGLCFPIQWPEPFGLVMIESLACGTPVLAHPRGSVPEILEQGRTGWIHPSIEGLARHAQDLTSLSRSVCRQTVETRFSLQRMTEDYLDAYRDARRSPSSSFWQLRTHQACPRPA